MSSKLTNRKSGVALLVIACITVFLLLTLFYIDEGKYSLEGLFRYGNFGNLIILFIILFVPAAGLFLWFGRNIALWLAVPLAIILGFPLIIAVFFGLAKLATLAG